MNSHSIRHKLVDDDEPPAKSKAMRPSSTVLNAEQSANGIADFVIINGGQQYPVHRSVLSKHSDYFQVLLEGTTCMRESQTNQVSLQGISDLALKAVIKYMYEGTIDISPSNLDDLLNAASHLQISSLLEQCSHWFSEPFDIQHYKNFVEIARKYCLPEALTNLNKQLAKLFPQLTKDRNLYFSLEGDQLLDVVSQDCLEVQSERELLTLLETWLTGEDGLEGPVSADEQEDFATRLLSQVRFRLMSRDELAHLNNSSNSYSCIVKSLIESAIRYHEDFTATKPVNSSIQNRIRSIEPCLVVVFASGVNKRHEILACRQHKGQTQMYNLYKDTAHQKTCGALTLDNRLYTLSLEHYGGFDHDSVVMLRCYDPCVRDQVILPCPELQAIPAGITTLEKKIYLCGGVSKCSTTFTNLCEAFDVLNLQWQRVASLPTAVHHSAAASLDGKVFLSGGQMMQSNTRVISKRVFSLQPGDEDWKEVAQMNVARRGHSMLAVGKEALIACGGLITSVSRTPTVVVVERYNIATDQWTEITGCSTIRGPSLGHFLLLPHEPNKLYTLGHEFQRAQEHEIWCTDLEDAESTSDNSKVHMTLPERFKLNDAYASHLYLNFNDKNFMAKRSY